MKKTNAARLLDAKSIAYELIEYEVDESDLSATTLAKKIGQNIEQIFKTLVLRGDKTGCFCCCNSRKCRSRPEKSFQNLGE